ISRQQGHVEAAGEAAAAIHQPQAPDTARLKQRLPGDVSMSRRGSPAGDNQVALRGIDLGHFLRAIAEPRPEAGTPQRPQPGFDPERRLPASGAKDEPAEDRSRDESAEAAAHPN